MLGIASILPLHHTFPATKVAAALNTQEQTVQNFRIRAFQRYSDMHPGEQINYVRFVEMLRERGLLSDRVLGELAERKQSDIPIPQERARRTQSPFTIQTDTNLEAYIWGTHAGGQEGRSIMIVCNEIEISINELRIFKIAESLMHPRIDWDKVAEMTRRDPDYVHAQVRTMLRRIRRRNPEFTSIEQVVAYCKEIGLFDPQVLIALQ